MLNIIHIFLFVDNKRAAAMMAVVKITDWTWNKKLGPQNKKNKKKSNRLTESCINIPCTIPSKSVYI